MPSPLFKLLRELDNANIYYFISRNRPDSILITATFVGKRIEIDVFENGHTEVSIFRGSESVEGDTSLIYEMIESEHKENTA